MNKAKPRHYIEIGERFGRLVVIGAGAPYVSPLGARARRWRCLCDCGNTILATTSSLNSGNTSSCGCFTREQTILKTKTHGRSATREWNIWSLMKGRCQNPSNRSWSCYGERGISVDPRWEKFENFYADMGDAPENHSLDRIDNNKGYSPENCRWATQSEQCRNRRNNRILELNGKSQTVAQWAEELRISRNTIMSRLRLGWTEERALTSRIITKSYERSEMKGKRKKISDAEKLASLLLLLTDNNGNPLIPEHLRKADHKLVLRHVQWDHVIPVAIGGTNAPQNLQPLTKEDHLEKTKKDISRIAKGKRLSKKQEEFRRKILAKSGQDVPSSDTEKNRETSCRPKTKIPTRPWPKTSRPLCGGGKIPAKPFPKPLRPKPKTE